MGGKWLWSQCHSLRCRGEVWSPVQSTSGRWGGGCLGEMALGIFRVPTGNRRHALGGAVEENLMRGLCSQMWAKRKGVVRYLGLGKKLPPLGQKGKGSEPSPEPGETGGFGRGVGSHRGTSLCQPASCRRGSWGKNPILLCPWVSVSEKLCQWPNSIGIKRAKESVWSMKDYPRQKESREEWWVGL